MIRYLIIGVFAAGFIALAISIFSSDKGRRGLVLALRSLWLHKLRSVLSVLGIIIGTFAVITLMAFGEGSMKDALDDIARQGATNVIVRSVKPSDDSSTQRRTRVAIYGLTYADYERFKTIPTVTQMVPMRIFPQEIRYLDRLRNGRVVATTAAYPDVNTEVRMASGRFLVDDDDDQMRNVAVLGSEVADRLFPFEDPLTQTVRLGNYFYEVVGVIANRQALAAVGGSSQASEDFNNDVYIPLRTCRARYGEKIMIRQSGSFSGEQVELSQVTLTMKDMDSVRPSGSIVRSLIERYHLKSDYAVTIPLDRLEAAEREKERFTQLLAMIAGISLLVGGIGIMNIMLATVTERTREIGIRRALGAKRRDIILQFLIEAVVQTSVGGLVGVILGVMTVFSVPWVAEHVFEARQPAVLNGWSIVYSLGVSVGVGVVFGLYPARRASRLDPIEALRHT
ncbi:ABC transporter permease [Fimbriiglobus ruber]|uniref:Cell division protein FtsX n=1 Tax=Fimbriiglobus ruber TaxID=1908690 RepID=A0A225DD60_9BACT|nr:ABC transporter permease [Fimbriiglobus ruber]OWK35089.1 Cell division protein FtsX [Fimbriiglobus ruber]